MLQSDQLLKHNDVPRLQMEILKTTLPRWIQHQFILQQQIVIWNICTTSNDVFYLSVL